MIQNIKTYISTNKKKITLCIILIIGSFALGRYTVPEHIKIETKIVEVEKKTSSKEKDKHKKKHKETTKTETDNKDGSKTIITKTTEDTKDDSNTKVVENEETNITVDKTEEIVHNKPSFNLSLLGGISLLHPEQGFVYGGAISTKLIGPTTLGAWGLSNGTAGLSVGLTF